MLENPVINNICRKTDDVLRSQKVIFSRSKLFEHFPDAPRQSCCVLLSQLVSQPGHGARRAGLPLVVTSVRWHLHPLLLFQASGNFLTAGQAPVLRTNKLQIGELGGRAPVCVCVCVRAVPRFVGGGGKKKKNNSSSKMLPTQIDRKVTSALHQKFLQTYKIKEFAFITHSKTHMEKWKHYIT